MPSLPFRAATWPGLALSLGAVALAACTTQPTPTPAVAKPTTPAVTGAATTPTTRPSPSPSPTVVAQRAFAELRNAQGAVVGVATFNQATPTRLEIDVTVTNIEPGRHGLHIHEVGRCEAPGFTTAGGHLNPTNRQHGLENPQGPHAGDLPVLVVDPNRSGQLRTTSENLTLSTGTAALFDADGSAVVIHAQDDDQRTDPTGNSGDRIACGVVQRGTAATSPSATRPALLASPAAPIATPVRPAVPATGSPTVPARAPVVPVLPSPTP